MPPPPPITGDGGRPPDWLDRQSRPDRRSAFGGRALAGVAGGADPVPAMALARLRAVGIARGQRPRPMDFRTLRQPGGPFRDARARPSRGRRDRARLSAARAGGDRALGRAALRRALVGLHALGALAHGAALCAGAGEIPRHAELRLFPHQARGTPAGAVGAGAGPSRSPEQAVMESAGLWMLLAVAIVLLATGL